MQLLELRHRAHARVEDRIRTGKDSGFGRFPSRQFAINAAWLELALIGIDLLAWTRTLLLDGEHALAEPKKLRYRLLHVAARLVRTARRTILRIARTLALGRRTRRRVRPPRRPAPTDRLTQATPHRLQGTQEHAGHRAGTPACPPHRPARDHPKRRSNRPVDSPTE